MAMDPLPPNDEAKHAAGQWSEMKPNADLNVHVPDGLDPIEGPAFAQAPVLYIDDTHETAVKPDGVDLLALKSRRRRRPSEQSTPTSTGFPNTYDHPSVQSVADTSVAFSSLELSYVPPQETIPVGVSVNTQFMGIPPNPQYTPRLAVEDVGGFLQSLTLTFSGNMGTIEFLRTRLVELGFDSIAALAFVTDNDLAIAGIAYPQDQHMIRTYARQDFVARRFQGPPDLYQMITMSKWLGECVIPRHITTFYTTHLQNCGYDSVQHFDSIGHDSRALSVFRPGHYNLFKYFLERVLQRHQQQVPQPYANQGYGMYYNNHSATNMHPPTTDDFNSTILDDLVPSGFPISPAVQPTTSMYQQQTPNDAAAVGGYYPPATNNAVMDTTAPSFTDMMQQDSSSAMPAPTAGGLPVRPMNEAELRLLYEAVNMDDKTNPCRRGKKIDWSVIATNGMGDVKFAVLAQYTADELEQNYVRNHELPLHNSARNSEWSPELIKLLWKVSQDTRCKNGAKTMWEQIATGRTGVAEYQPLAKFSNSQLRSRFRTEFGDKRPQSRKKARETKNALARAAAAMGLATGDRTTAQLKSAAKQKAVASKARANSHDEHRIGLVGNGPPNPPPDSGSMAV